MAAVNFRAIPRPQIIPHCIHAHLQCTWNHSKLYEPQVKNAQSISSVCMKIIRTVFEAVNDKHSAEVTKAIQRTHTVLTAIYRHISLQPRGYHILVQCSPQAKFKA